MGETGRVGNLTKDQATKLEKFKESVKDVLQEKHTDYHLLRFLRARHFNLKKTEEMFRKDIEWRKTYNSDFAKKYELPEAIDKYWVGGDFGCDKDGNLAIIIPIGLIDPRGIIFSIKSNEGLNVGIWHMQDLYQKIKDNSKTQGRYIEGVVGIFDLEGVNASFLWKPSMTLFNNMVQAMEQHYPETIKTVFVVNAPAIFPVAYSLIKPFIHPDTRKKIKVLKGNSKKVLLNYFDADVLPKHYGGNRTDSDGDPRCPSIIKQGGKIPESYYVNNQLFDEGLLTKISVGKGSSKELHYEVHVPNSGIRYLFKTDEGEIIFSISKRSGKTEGSDVIKEPQKITCHITPADGEVTAKEVGTYLLRFENPSYLKSKTLSFQIEVLEPDEDLELEL